MRLGKNPLVWVRNVKGEELVVEKMHEMQKLKVYLNGVQDVNSCQM